MPQRSVNVPSVRPLPLLGTPSSEAAVLMHFAERLLDEELHSQPELDGPAAVERLFGLLQSRFYLPFRGQPAYTLQSQDRLRLSSDELELAISLQLIRELPPPERRYDSALVFGGLFSSALAQKTLFEASAVASPQIYVLGSDRPLLPVELWQMKEHLGAPALESRPRTELQMLEVLWTSRELASPASTLRASDTNLHVHFVRTPNRSNNPPGASELPGTNETIEQLIQKHRTQTGARLLAVSSQPYIRYQVLALTSSMLEHGAHLTRVEGCGPAAPESALTVDAYGNMLAKLVFEERRLMNLVKHSIAPAQSG